ncbi:60S ribosomal subunit assembly or modification protein [Zalaria obscura]|uniref:60S ribosomal subunit assembly or modification protein n=1 Tax=Zalaria obscura TaxID=2024903 RepID=A0ACC3SE13_9PEZI
MSAHDEHEDYEGMEEEENEMFDPAEAEEEIPEGDDVHMDSDEEDDGMLEEIQLQNDSVAHFDGHKDSIFCIAQHPTDPSIIATGGGDDVAYIWNCTPPETPVLPASYQTNPQPVERKSQDAWAKLEGHSDSINTIAFTLPRGEFVVTGGLDGRVSVYKTPSQPGAAPLVGTAQEVEEINWIIPCPHPSYPNTFAMGALDGSVWVYTINAADTASPLNIVQAFYLHTGPCTAGSWTPDGKLLATVSEDSSLYVWDVFGEAAAAGLTDPGASQAVVGLTAADERFNVVGGLYSVTVSPGGAIVAVGGPEGNIRIVGLPRLSMPSQSVTSGAKGAGARNKVGGGKQAGGPKGGQSQAASGQAGQILAALQAQSDGVETLAFSQPPLTLLAAGSVDGSIALFDAAHNFAVRRHIKEAHEEEAVIKVQFVKSNNNDSNWLLTSCGNDGVIRRWDVRGGTAAAGHGFVGEWRGHRGGGEGGGIFDFVQGDGGKTVVTAGDDGVSLVFNMSS